MPGPVAARKRASPYSRGPHMCGPYKPVDRQTATPQRSASPTTRGRFRRSKRPWDV